MYGVPFFCFLKEPGGSWHRLFAMKWEPAANTRSSSCSTFLEPAGWPVLLLPSASPALFRLRGASDCFVAWGGGGRGGWGFEKEEIKLVFHYVPAYCIS